MQQESRSNADRTRETRSALIVAARKLFVEKGYGDTGTPAIVELANVTRGALYHHFKDKRDLFASVLEAEAAAVAQQIDAHVNTSMGAAEALIVGGEAYLKAMSVPGRVQLLLIEGPAILGQDTLEQINRAHGRRELEEGLEHAMAGGHLLDLPIEALSKVLSAMYDAAALALAYGGKPADYKAVISAILVRLIGDK